MQTQDSDRMVKFRTAQASAEAAHSRLAGADEIPPTEELREALHAGHRMINALRGLLGLGWKGGVA